MDEERYVQENRDRRMQEIAIRMPEADLDSVNYRLMQEWEVPDWIRVKDEDQDL